MSNLDPRPAAVSLQAGVVHAVDVLEARKAAIGDGTEVRRLLPQRVLTVSASGPSRLFIAGGVPLGDRLVMWWNFVARTNEEIVTARNAWVAGTFGEVRGCTGEPLAAPPLAPGGLKPRLRNSYVQ